MNKTCKRCTYKQRSMIDYHKSIREQKIVEVCGRICIRCDYVDPRSYSEYKYYNLNDEDIIKKFNVDLTKIIHDCNKFRKLCDRCEYIDPKYDEEGNCIELSKHYRSECTRCEKQFYAGKRIAFKIDDKDINDDVRNEMNRLTKEAKLRKHWDMGCNYEYHHSTINYEESIRKQKIVEWITKVCVQCGKPDCPCKVVEHDLTNKEVIDRLSVDLTKIVHDCNQFKEPYDKWFEYRYIDPIYDNGNKCIQVTEQRRYQCSRCKKELESDFNMFKDGDNNLSERVRNEMDKLTKSRIYLIKHDKHGNGTGNCPVTNKPYEHKTTNYWSSEQMYSMECSYDIVCSECGKLFEHYYQEPYTSTCGRMK